MPSTLSETNIANLALSKLGNASGGLTDLWSDDSEAAAALRLVFVACRDLVLEQFDWDFATKRASIAADATAPVWGYARQFVLPADFIRVRSIYGIAVLKGAAYSVEDGKFLTDIEAPLKLRYIARVTDTSKFSPSFIEALACKLADAVCEPITKSSTRRKGLQQEYLVALAQARKANAMGRATAPAPDGSWNDARGSSGSI